MLEVLKSLNWVDVFTLFLIIRLCYIAIDKGLPIEISKLFSTIFAIYLSLHYYVVFGDVLRGKAGPTEIVPDFFDLAAFGLLLAAGYLTFVVLRKVFLREPKEGAANIVQRLVCIIAGLARGVLLVSLISYLLLISGVDYFKKSVIDSYSGNHIVKAAPAVYDFLWYNIVSKFADKEQHNQLVAEVTQSIAK